MCSYEDRIRAVKLYIKLDKRIAAATIIQLGYPKKNALKTWYRKSEQRQDASLIADLVHSDHAILNVNCLASGLHQYGIDWTLTVDVLRLVKTQSPLERVICTEP